MGAFQLLFELKRHSTFGDRQPKDARRSTADRRLSNVAPRSSAIECRASRPPHDRRPPVVAGLSAVECRTSRLVRRLPPVGCRMSVSSCHTALRQLELDGIRLALGQQPLDVTFLQHVLLARRTLCYAMPTTHAKANALTIVITVRTISPTINRLACFEHKLGKARACYIFSFCPVMFPIFVLPAFQIF